MTNSTENTQADDTVAVQVRVTTHDNDRLETVAKKLGCSKATILRFLIRQADSLAVTFDGHGVQ